MAIKIECAWSSDRKYNQSLSPVKKYPQIPLIGNLSETWSNWNNSGKVEKAK